VLRSDLILIDSSIWVRYLRRGADPAMVLHVRSWLDAGRVATTDAIKLELLPACRTEPEHLRLSTTLDALHSLPSDDAVWSTASWNGFVLRRVGVIVPAMDLLIATVAQQFGVELAYMDHHYELMAPHLSLRTISLL
jgi:predicted nucleic acid-binding protein